METMTNEYSTMTFNQVFPDDQSFVDSMTSYVGAFIDTERMELTFLLLSARYGNSPIANRSVEQFKLRCWSTMFQYAPAWITEMKIQNDLTRLSIEDIREGSKATFNQALNPETEPSTDTDEELPYINGQNTTKYKKSKIEGYASLMEVIKTDVTEKYLSKFKKLFKKFVIAENPLLFVTEKGE